MVNNLPIKTVSVIIINLTSIQKILPGNSLSSKGSSPHLKKRTFCKKLWKLDIKILGGLHLILLDSKKNYYIRHHCTPSQCLRECYERYCYEWSEESCRMCTCLHYAPSSVKRLVEWPVDNSVMTSTYIDWNCIDGSYMSLVHLL